MLASPARAPKAIAVIGGGPAGCSAAHFLRERGHEVTLFEREAEVGGRTWTLRRDGESIDTGAGFISRSYSTVRRLAEQLGVRYQPVRRPPRTALVSPWGGFVLRPGSPLGLLRYPWMSWRDKLRLVVHTLRVAWSWRRLDLFDAASLEAADGETAAAYGAAHLGPRVTAHFLRSLLEPLLFVRSTEVSRALLLGILAEAPRAGLMSCPTGMDSLCRALVRDVRVVLSCNVLGLSQRDGRPTVRLPGEERAFDRVVVATTADVAVVLASGTPWLTERGRLFLASRRYAASVHAIFRLDSSVRAAAAAAIPVGPDAAPLASVNLRGADGSGFEDDRPAPLVSVYSTDVTARELAGRSDGEVSEHLFGEARRLLPALAAAPASAHLIRRDHALPIPEVGSFGVARAFLSDMRPPVLFCGDYLATPAVEGAVRSGILAAQRALA